MISEFNWLRSLDSDLGSIMKTGEDLIGWDFPSCLRSRAGRWRSMSRRIKIELAMHTTRVWNVPFKLGQSNCGLTRACSSPSSWSSLAWYQLSVFHSVFPSHCIVLCILGQRKKVAGWGRSLWRTSRLDWQDSCLTLFAKHMHPTLPPGLSQPSLELHQGLHREQYDDLPWKTVRCRQYHDACGSQLDSKLPGGRMHFTGRPFCCSMAELHYDWNHSNIEVWLLPHLPEQCPHRLLQEWGVLHCLPEPCFAAGQEDWRQ